MSEPENPGDAVLLMHGMLLMCGADGALQPEEVNTLQVYYRTMPEFEGKPFNEFLQRARQVRGRYHSAIESMEALGGIQSVAVRRKLFVMAVDLAMASQGIVAAENKMLLNMQDILALSDDLARKVIEVQSLKYAR